MSQNQTVIYGPPDLSTQSVDPSLYPLLAKIKSPEDLRRLPQNTLPEVCADIRRFLINQLSQNPGHFASSMGAVELTVALHYVLDTPYDRIVWDVGHQAYGHKLITGRADRFHTNRKLGGISGFPTPSESEYDTFSAGHASNSISAALGMSVATSLMGDEPQRKVVAVIGDAAICGGTAFEAINNAANANANVLIILNDNDMSIDHNTGSLNSYLAHITASKGYNNVRYKLYNALRSLHLISDKNRGRILRFNNSLKSLITREQNLFEGLNIRYFGPFDGHDIHRIIRVLTDIKDMTGPRLLHLRTVKGKGFVPAENDPASWHAPGRFNPQSGERSTSKKTPYRKFQDVFGETLVELASADAKVVSVTAAMPSGTSVSMMQRRYPERTFDVGISEGHAVTFAGGMAREGLRPVVAIYSSFLQRGFDHIVNDIALQHLPVVFAVDRSGLVGEDGATHHGALDLAYLSAVPGMTVAAPADELELRNMLYTALSSADPGPVAIRYPRGSGSMEYNQWHQPMQVVATGNARMLHKGTDVAILSLGTIATEVTRAVEELERNGISVTHWDMRYLKPLDVSVLEGLKQASMPILTIEDASIQGGLGSAVATWLMQNGADNRLHIIGIPDKFVAQGTIAELRSLCGMDAEAIVTKVTQLVKS